MRKGSQRGKVRRSGGRSWRGQCPPGLDFQPCLSGQLTSPEPSPSCPAGFPSGAGRASLFPGIVDVSFLSLNLPGHYQVWARGSQACPRGPRPRAHPGFRGQVPSTASSGPAPACTQPDVSPAFRTGNLEPASGESVYGRAAAGTGDAAALNEKG